MTREIFFSDLYEKEYKSLSKRYRSLHDDIALFIEMVKVFPQGRGEKHWNQLFQCDQFSLWKVRLSCSSLKNKSLRLVYAFFPIQNICIFLDLYYKGDRPNENKIYIDAFVKQHQPSH